MYFTEFINFLYVNKLNKNKKIKEINGMHQFLTITRNTI